MTTVVQVLSTEAGVGKSATAVLLADAVAECGERVHLLDVGGQATSARWLESWQTASEVRLTVRAPELTWDTVAWTQAGRQLEALRDGPYDVIVVDTPAGSGNSDWPNGLAALEQTDAGVLVVGAETADLDETSRALRRLVVHAGQGRLTQLAVLLTQGPGTVAVEEIRGALETGGATVLDTVMPDSSTRERRYGKPPAGEIAAVGRDIAVELCLL